MDTTISVRHFELNNEVKNYAASSMEAAFDQLRIKISNATMVLDMQKNLITASISVAAKDYPVGATSAAYDNVYKAIDDAIAKASAQLRRYLDKRQDHKADGIAATEQKQVEKD